MKSIETTASSYDDAVKEALEALELTIEQVDVETLKVSGIIRKKTTVRVTQKKTGDILALEFVEGVIEKMGVDCTACVSEVDGAYLINLSGEGTPKLIGYRGDVLDSLQYLALLVCNKNNPDNKRLSIDGENYREKRTITLSKLAKRLAFQASKSSEKVALEPMNPFERRIIHSALHDDKFVTTESAGEEPNRYVVIKPIRRSRPDGDRPRYNSDRPSYNNDKPRYNNDKPRYNSDKPSSYSERRTYSGDAENIVNTTDDSTYTHVDNRAFAPVTEVVSSPAPDESSAVATTTEKPFNRTKASKMRSFGGPKSRYF